MMANKWTRLLLTAALVLLAGGIAAADGGGPEPGGCPQALPAPTPASPLLKGFFVAGYDRSACAVAEPDCRHSNIHVVLEMPQLVNGEEKIVRHLFSMHWKETDPVCGFSDDELMQKYKFGPCIKRVGEAFGLPGVPVISNLKVVARDFCEDPDRAMIYGTLMVQVVPPQCQ